MSLPPAVDPWVIYAGDDSEIPILVREDGLPADLTGWSDWRAMWRGDGVVDPVPLVVDTGFLARGIVVVSCPGSYSDAVTGSVRSGVWDVQAVHDGRTRTFARGKVVWSEDVTR